MRREMMMCAAVFAGAVCWNAAGAEKKQSAEAAAASAPAPAVLVEPVAEIDEDVARKYVGELQPIEEVDLRARISGNITAIHFKEGDFVKPGQLLFELEDTTYRAKAQSAKAVCDQVDAELKYAESNYQRQKELFDKSATSKSAWEEAERLYSLSKAKCDAAAAERMDAENNLSYARIVSPIAGRIGKVTYTKGNYVTLSSDKLADIVQTDPIYAAFAVSENDFLRLFGSVETMKEKGVVALQLADGSNYKVPGKVALIDNKVDSTTGTMMIWATFENPENKLIPGGLVTVMLSRKAERKYPAIRLSGLLNDQHGSYVFVVGPNNIVERRQVKLGSMIGNYQIITDGVKPGETVIVDGTHKAHPGAPVTPVASESAR